MSDINKALERWEKYAETHRPHMVEESIALAAAGLSRYTPSDKWDLIGWAHDELVRRGHRVETQDNTAVNAGTSACVVTLEDRRPSMAEAECCQTRPYRFDAPTLLDAYLDAIEATEPKSEVVDIDTVENSSGPGEPKNKARQ